MRFGIVGLHEIQVGGVVVACGPEQAADAELVHTRLGKPEHDGGAVVRGKWILAAFDLDPLFLIGIDKFQGGDRTLEAHDCGEVAKRQLLPELLVPELHEGLRGDHRCADPGGDGLGLCFLAGKLDGVRGNEFVIRRCEIGGKHRFQGLGPVIAGECEWSRPRIDLVFSQISDQAGDLVVVGGERRGIAGSEFHIRLSDGGEALFDVGRLDERTRRRHWLDRVH